MVEVSDELRNARQVIATEVEGDSDNPLRVAEARAILAGTRDKQYATLRAIVEPDAA